MVRGSILALSLIRAISCRFDGAATPYLCHAHATNKHLHLALLSCLGSWIRQSSLYLSFDCAAPRNFPRGVCVLSSLWSTYKNIPRTQPRTMSKLTSSFHTFLADAFPENGKGEACAVGLRLPVAQRLSFDCFKPDD